MNTFSIMKTEKHIGIKKRGGTRKAPQSGIAVPKDHGTTQPPARESQRRVRQPIARLVPGKYNFYRNNLCTSRQPGPLSLTTPIPNYDYDVWMKEIYLKKEHQNKTSYFIFEFVLCVCYRTTLHTRYGKDMVWFLSYKVCLAPPKMFWKKISPARVCAMEVS